MFNIRLNGFRELAAQYRGDAIKLLYGLRNQMNLGNLKQGMVSKILKDGTIIRVGSIFGLGMIEITSPFRMPIKLGQIGATYVYIADSFNARIQVFDLGGNFQFSFGCLGTGDGQFLFPFDLDYWGNVLYIDDTNRKNINKFTLGGGYIDTKSEIPNLVYSPEFNTKGLLHVGEGSLYIYSYLYDINLELQQKLKWASVDNIPTPIALDASGTKYTSMVLSIGKDKLIAGGIRWDSVTSSYIWEGFYAYDLSSFSLIGALSGLPSGHAYKGGTCYNEKFYSIAVPLDCVNPDFETCIDVYDLTNLTFEKTIIPKFENNNLVLRGSCNGYTIGGIDVHSTGIWLTERYVGAGISSYDDSDRVLHLNMNGKFISTFGVRGHNNGQFAYPTGIKLIDINSNIINTSIKCEVPGSGVKDEEGNDKYEEGSTGHDIYDDMSGGEPCPIISIDSIDVTIQSIHYSSDCSTVVVYATNHIICNTTFSIAICGMGSSPEWDTEFGAMGVVSDVVDQGSGCYTAIWSDICVDDMNINPLKLRVFSLDGKEAILIINNPAPELDCETITIAGVDTILRNGSETYTITGNCNGSITWSVSAGTGSSLGGSTITQGGVLTAGATACGSLLITATCDVCGTSATQYIRVTDAGRWIEIGICVNLNVLLYCYEPSNIWDTYNGNIRYETKTRTCQYSCKPINKSCTGDTTYLDPYCEETDPGYYEQTWYTRRYRWEC